MATDGKRAGVEPMSNLEEHLLRTTKRALEHGYDLVKVSSHHNPCPKCKPWQGKILSITGRTHRYATLQQAINAGLFHEGCRHAIGIHIDLKKEIELLEAEIRQPPTTSVPSNVGCGCSTMLVLVLLVIIIIATLGF